MLVTILVLCIRCRAVSCARRIFRFGIWTLAGHLIVPAAKARLAWRRGKGPQACVLHLQGKNPEKTTNNRSLQALKLGEKIVTLGGKNIELFLVATHGNHPKASVVSSLVLSMISLIQRLLCVLKKECPPVALWVSGCGQV
jgi:hypothetical protein